MYDSIFSLLLWLVALALAVVSWKASSAIKAERERLTKLAKLSGSPVSLIRLSELDKVQTVTSWVWVLSIAYMLWNAREAFRVFFL